APGPGISPNVWRGGASARYPHSGRIRRGQTPSCPFLYPGIDAGYSQPMVTTAFARDLRSPRHAQSRCRGLFSGTRFCKREKPARRDRCLEPGSRFHSASLSPRVTKQLTMNDDLEQRIEAAVKNPQNLGEMENADAVGTVGSADCGDMLRMWVKFKEENGRKVIDRATFQTFGCQTAIAVASVATEMLAGKTIE